jgi:hypothetical protein
MEELKDARAVVAAVVDLGLLFVSDEKRENAIKVLTGEFPRGSWWSHPQANAIYDILQEVERAPDVLLAKLLGGKVTLIHRTLWPALLVVVTAREPWQVDGLSPGAVQALTALDEAETTGSEPPAVSRTVSKELEGRLLAHAVNLHAPGGKHVTRLEPWRVWATAAGCPVPPSPAPVSGPALAEAKQVLEAAATRLGALPLLPWKT